MTDKEEKLLKKLCKDQYFKDMFNSNIYNGFISNYLNDSSDENCYFLSDIKSKEFEDFFHYSDINRHIIFSIINFECYCEKYYSVLNIDGIEEYIQKNFDNSEYENFLFELKGKKLHRALLRYFIKNFKVYDLKGNEKTTEVLDFIIEITEKSKCKICDFLSYLTICDLNLR